MRVYLDNCCYNRPFDDQSNLAVAKGILKKIREIGTMRVANPVEYITGEE